MEAQEPCGPDGGSATGLFGAMFSTVKSSLTSAWNAISKDGTLAAAGRQGADELGMALKAFPDSIQADEVGTIWNPTQGEIAANRSNQDSVPEVKAAPLPSPSEIARGSNGVSGQEQNPGLVLISPTPSPSEIAKASSADVYGTEQSKGQPLPSPSDIARDNGDVFMQDKKSWADREAERDKAKQEGNAENDQSERAKGRSLPDEQKEQEHDRGRSR